MPELPEVETMVRGIRSAVVGRRIERLTKCRCTRKPLTITPTLPTIRKRIVGRTVRDVFRRAKRVVVELDSEDRIVIEPRMTGLMLLSDPPSIEHLRLQWSFDDGNSLWYWDRRGLGTCRLLNPEQYAEQVEAKLGPEPLALAAEDWSKFCNDRRRAIKVMMLDQSIVAGIGNLYASEILHIAGVHPERTAASLDSDEIEGIASACRQVLATAIRYEGSTLSDGTYRNALNKEGGYQNEHRVYARGGELCPTCRSETVRRIVQAQRSTFFCPACQPASG